MKNKICFITPVFNEEKSIPLFLERIDDLINKLSNDYEIEVFFSNNSSTDRTLDLIKESANINKNYSIKYITLSRNFGYQNSLTAALENSTADYYFIVDVDCEDPPELIIEFIHLHKNLNYDLIYGRRVDRVENPIIKYFRKIFYYLLKLTADAKINLYMAEFSFFNHDFKTAIIECKSNFQFLRSDFSYVGFSQFGYNYKRHVRIAGKTKYNFYQMFVFAVAGILSSSTFPLRIISYFSLVLLFFTTLALFNIFPSNILKFLFFIYVTYSIAFIGLYTARMYKSILKKPLYFIDKKKSNIYASI
jgi:glycosyltransferase involved in cell wall biosynthesis